MTKRIALVHALKVAMQPIEDAFRTLWPAADCVNILDDSLAPDLAAAGRLTPELFRRFCALTAYAEAIGADGLLFTCSAFGDAISLAARTSRLPVVKPNEGMFDAALDQGTRVAMIVTNPSAVASMENEFYELARARQSAATLTTVCVPSALVAINNGDAALHNALVAEAAEQLAGYDALLLAHFSTSYAEAAVREKTRTPVFTSPASAVRKVRALVERGGG
ncbi:arylsulfatase [Rhodoplanes serenus]|uniref:Arylsulfatase n=1 Tax=Rhodoplanes serenus TaxID=200615 RepID=A0A9X4XSI9_9BRAD|nr:aspartate/glutamate racemase family protein [Rhodoplanes serenus]MTW19169.1 arylsulfatase [Rhodoplanes serenus]